MSDKLSGEGQSVENVGKVDVSSGGSDDGKGSVEPAGFGEHKQPSDAVPHTATDSGSY